MIAFGSSSAISISEIKSSRKWIINVLNKNAVATVE
jgi:hypothetical protein